MKNIFILAVAIAALAGCTKSPNLTDIPSSHIIKGKVTPMTPSTKVTATDITASKVEFKWESGDQVAYLAGTEDEPILVIATCTDPANGTFELEASTDIVEGEEYQVIYPVPDADLLPTTKEERRNGNIATKHIIAGSGSLSGFCLDQHCPVVHLPLKGSATVGKIELLPLCDDEYTLEFGTIQTCGANGVALGSETTDFYISMNTADTIEDITYFKIKVYDTDNNKIFDKNGSGNLEELGRIIDMPVIEISGI